MPKKERIFGKKKYDRQRFKVCLDLETFIYGNGNFHRVGFEFDSTKRFKQKENRFFLEDRIKWQFVWPFSSQLIQTAIWLEMPEFSERKEKFNENKNPIQFFLRINSEASQMYSKLKKELNTKYICSSACDQRHLWIECMPSVRQALLVLKMKNSETIQQVVEHWTKRNENTECLLSFFMRS